MKEIGNRNSFICSQQHLSRRSQILYRQKRAEKTHQNPFIYSIFSFSHSAEYIPCTHINSPVYLPIRSSFYSIYCPSTSYFLSFDSSIIFMYSLILLRCIQFTRWIFSVNLLTSVINLFMHSFIYLCISLVLLNNFSSLFLSLKRSFSILGQKHSRILFLGKML